MGTRYGKINDLRVPRDRDNEFRTALFQPYQRSIGIDDLVVSMYSKGISITEYESHWEYNKELRRRISVTQRVLKDYSEILAKVAKVDLLYEK